MGSDARPQLLEGKEPSSPPLFPLIRSAAMSNDRCMMTGAGLPQDTDKWELQLSLHMVRGSRLLLRI